MLSMARALMQDPQLLLLDEPSLGLSPKIMKQLFIKVKEINGQGVTIMIVEQNVRQALAIADKVFVLDDGKIVLSGTKKILSNKRIEKIYLGGR